MTASEERNEGHTPGPWTTETDVFDEVEGRVWCIMGADRSLLATLFAPEREYVRKADNMSPQAAGNAAVMRAAPALLAALEAWIDWYDNTFAPLPPDPGSAVPLVAAVVQTRAAISLAKEQTP